MNLAPKNLNLGPYASHFTRITNTYTCGVTITPSVCGGNMARFSKVPPMAIQTREKCIVPIISTTFTSKLFVQCMDNVVMFFANFFLRKYYTYIIAYLL